MIPLIATLLGLSAGLLVWLGKLLWGAATEISTLKGELSTERVLHAQTVSTILSDIRELRTRCSVLETRATSTDKFRAVQESKHED